MMASLLSFFTITTIYHSTFAIDCPKAADCACNANEPCLLNCIGTDWCKGDSVNLRCATGYPCTLNCNGAQSCTDSKLIPNGATYINITCSGSNACTGNANFKCQSDKPCSINCKTGSNTCQKLSVDINSASDFICSGSNCPLSFPPPFAAPTIPPTLYPTKTPTNTPTNPTSQPITNPPTAIPSYNPTDSPTNNPTPSPTTIPSYNPTYSPTNNPTASPTQNPTPAPSNEPTTAPSNAPISPPSNAPSIIPTLSPSKTPTIIPSLSPTFKGESKTPSDIPTSSPVIDGEVSEIITTLITVTKAIEIGVVENDATDIVMYVIVIVLGLVAGLFIGGLIVLIRRKIKRIKSSLIVPVRKDTNLQMEVEVNHHHIAPIKTNEYNNEIREQEICEENYLSKAQQEMVDKTKGRSFGEKFLSEAQKVEKMKTKGGAVSSKKSLIMYDDNDTHEFDSHSEMYDEPNGVIVYAQSHETHDNNSNMSATHKNEKYYDQVVPTIPIERILHPLYRK